MAHRSTTAARIPSASIQQSVRRALCNAVTFDPRRPGRAFVFGVPTRSPKSERREGRWARRIHARIERIVAAEVAAALAAAARPGEN